MLLTDAQTSGGLLLCVAKKRLNSVADLRMHIERFPPPCGASSPHTTAHASGYRNQLPPADPKKSQTRRIPDEFQSRTALLNHWLDNGHSRLSFAPG